MKNDYKKRIFILSVTKQLKLSFLSTNLVDIKYLTVDLFIDQTADSENNLYIYFRFEDLYSLVESVGVDEPGCGEDDGAQVAHRHGQQDCVGGRRHLGLGQDADDDEVCHGGDDDEERHDEPVDWLDEVKRTEEGAGVDNIARLGEHATKI